MPTYRIVVDLTVTKKSELKARDVARELAAALEIQFGRSITGHKVNVVETVDEPVEISRYIPF